MNLKYLTLNIFCIVQITEALSDDLGKLDGIDRDKVQLLIKFWQPFKRETAKLEGEDYPTLPLVCLAET